MKEIIFVGLGGFIGAVARYKMSGLILHRTADWKFPLSTFLVNVLGCLIAGLLAGLVEKHDMFSPAIRLLLFTGILGGFTTFSAFGVETVTLIQRQEPLIALAYVLSSVTAGVFVLWAGVKIVV